MTKKATLIALVVLAAMAPLPADAARVKYKHGHKKSGEVTYNVLLAGGTEANVMRIWLTPDGRTYVIDSVVPLEVGGSVCENAPGNPNELLCRAIHVSAFEVNAGGGDDQIRVAGDVKVPVTMRGGPGRDVLVGGAGPDRLLGGPGGDRMIGRDGDDVMFGGDGYDVLFGGPGSDLIRGGAAADSVFGGPGDNDVRQD